jgi:hypothetical protein
MLYFGIKNNEAIISDFGIKIATSTVDMAVTFFNGSSNPFRAQASYSVP